MVLAGLAAMAAHAQANVISLVAEQAAAPASRFGLDFGDGSGFRDVNITQTDFRMRLDQSGPPSAWTARFDSYVQSVPALELPDGQGGSLSTGALTVEIVPGSSSGTLTENQDGTFEFSTTDTYQISFAGDLSAIGFFSPVVLSSTTTGLITPDAGRTVGLNGNVNIGWTGLQELGATGIMLSYRCDVAATYVGAVIPEPTSLALLAGGVVGVFRRRR
jgi:hypothetical protein